MTELPEEFSIKERWYVVPMKSTIFRSDGEWMQFTEIGGRFLKRAYGPDPIDREHAERVYEEYEIHEEKW